jgi:NAD+ kinase
MTADKNNFQKIAVLAHPQVAPAAGEAKKIAAYLQSCDLEAEDGYLNDEALRKRIQSNEFDLVVTLGGDGTVLRAGHLCAPYSVPILAINHGRFGFLIEVPPGKWKKYLDDLLAGDYWIEERMMLDARLWRNEKAVEEWDVLNEIVVGRGHPVRPVHLQTSLNGQPLTTYVADALIVATPTGSTAYSLAAGGPVLPPELRNILLVPVAPHLSMDRAIVLAEGSDVSVEILSSQQSVLSVDGQEPIPLYKGDRVEVRVSQHIVRLVRFQKAGYFYSSIISIMDQHPSAGDVAE